MENKIIAISNNENKMVPIYRSNTKEIHLHSMYDLERESTIVFSKYFRADIKEYIFIGFGFGYHIRKFLNCDVKIKIVVLNKEVYELAKESISIDKISECKGVEFIFIEDLDKKSLMEISTDGDNVIFHTPSIHIMDNEDKKKVIQEKHIRYNSLKKSEKVMKNNLEYNMIHVHHKLSSIINEFSHKNVLITGAGPSLKKDIPFIKKNRDKLLLFASGTSLKPLLSQGVCPDFVIITDSSTEVYKQIADVNIDKPLLILDTASKNLVDLWNGKVILCAQAFHNNNINEKDIVKSGGSVVTTAIDIAINAHSKLIILAGADFCYTNNRSHVEGANRSTYLEDTDRDFIQVKNYNGEYCKTARSLVIFKEWIESRIHDIEIPVYNLTSEGAIIKNTLRLDNNGLSELLDRK